MTESEPIDDRPAGVRNFAGNRRAVAMVSLVVVLNAVAWLTAWSFSSRFSFLLATGWLAYAFGLRHAVDADHIAAIDNTTRKLMREGKRPIGVGFFFSLGHSTVVMLLCAGLAAGTAYFSKHLPTWTNEGSVIGTIISGGFLYLIGLVNLLVLVDIFAKARKHSSAQSEPGSDSSEIPGPGLLVRLLRPLLGLVRQSWHMYFVGFLFGLGFDTASEVGILALSARSGQSGVPFWAVMLLPVLFTVGMCLVDTLDGILMIGAYGWALDNPMRKVRYNAVITGISVLVAFIVGTDEIVDIVNPRNLPHTAFWSTLHDNLGFVIVALFALFWATAAVVWKAANRSSEYEAA